MTDNGTTTGTPRGTNDVRSASPRAGDPHPTQGDFTSLVTNPPTSDKAVHGREVDARGHRCSGCWKGAQQPTNGRADRHAWTDCDRCGLPGPKPADYPWHGLVVSHYVNHGNTWQGVAAPLSASQSMNSGSRVVSSASPTTGEQQ